MCDCARTYMLVLFGKSCFLASLCRVGRGEGEQFWERDCLTERNYPQEMSQEGESSSEWTSGVMEEGSFYSTSLWWTLEYLRTPLPSHPSTRLWVNDGRWACEDRAETLESEDLSQLQGAGQERNKVKKVAVGLGGRLQQRHHVAKTCNSDSGGRL